MVAVITPAATSVTPPPAADKSTVGPVTIAPLFSATPPVPDASASKVPAPRLPVTVIEPAPPSPMEIVPAVTGPLIARLPVKAVFVTRKLPDFTAKKPMPAMLFAVPAR